MQLLLKGEEKIQIILKVGVLHIRESRNTDANNVREVLDEEQACRVQLLCLKYLLFFFFF